MNTAAEFAIRPATEADLDRIAEIKVASWADTYGSLVEPAVLRPFLDRDRAAIRRPGCNMRPLPRVRALREEPAELVERRFTAQDAVRVMVDQFDRVQYFEKWPCCSNASSPSE